MVNSFVVLLAVLLCNLSYSSAQQPQCPKGAAAWAALSAQSAGALAQSCLNQLSLFDFFLFSSIQAYNIIMCD